MFDTTVLVVGIDKRSKDLEEMPLRIITMQTGLEAIRCLKEERIDAVASSWELDDMPEGRFLSRLMAVRPNFPAVAFIEDGNEEQEISARHAGVAAVLTNNTDSDYFRQIVCQILGFSSLCCVHR